MVPLNKWITDTTAVESSMGVSVDPRVRANPLALLQLKVLLSVIFKTSDVSECDSLGSLDMRVYRKNGAINDFRWATKEALTSEITKLAARPMPFVRMASADMVVHVAASYELTNQVAYVLQRHVGAKIIPKAGVASLEAYDGRVLELYVPGLGMMDPDPARGCISFEALAELIGEVFAFGRDLD